MNRLLIAIPVALLLVACTKEPISTEASDNPAVPVALLFNHEGCSVYRFEDNGRSHYFTRCGRDDTTTSTAYREQSGKHTTTRYRTIELKGQP
jgi:hypothetical protein